MTTTNPDLQKIWPELCDIFKDFHKLSTKHIQRLEKLGFRVAFNNVHPKIYIPYNGTTYLVVFSSTPSDRNAGKQILRQIRRVYEQKY